MSEASPTGYGRAGRSWLRALRARGVPLSWTPMVEGRRWGMWLHPLEGALPGDEFEELVHLDTDYDTVIVSTIPEYYAKWRQREAGKRLIGMTVWEFDKVPPPWVDTLNQMDAVVVPCQWNRDVFVAAGVHCPIHVAPHPREDARDFPPLQLAEVGSEDFVFYTIADWNERNAPHLTLTGFLSAFSEEDAAVLVVKTSPMNRRRKNGFWWYRVGRYLNSPARDVGRIRKATRSRARVLLITDRWSDEEIGGLHRRGDCYVSLTRAEGWGLGAYEAAQAAKPVVITGHGGQTDFLPRDLAYHVPHRLITYDRASFPGLEWTHIGASWADPDVEAGGALMRHIFENRSAARRRGDQLRQHIADNFDNWKITEGLLHFLESLPPTRGT